MEVDWWLDPHSPALAARLTVLVPSHEDTGTTGGGGALAAETLDLAVRADLVVLKDGHLDLLPLVLDLLGGGLGRIRQQWPRPRTKVHVTRPRAAASPRALT
jgi:hypothetical protein